MSRILVVGDPHGDLMRFRAIVVKHTALASLDAIIFTGDLGRADKARALAFGGVVETPARVNASQKEQYESAAKILAFSACIAPTYYIQGNVENTDPVVQQAVEEAARRVGARCLDYRVRNICGLRVGGIPFYRDLGWANKFKPSDAKLKIKSVRQTERVQRTLEKFGHLAVLVTHVPPYGTLDKVTSLGAPKTWIGKRAGSKVFKDYIAVYEPPLVFCGHIHEGQGIKRIGNTVVRNLGCGGAYVLTT